MRSIREDRWKISLAEQTGYSYFGGRYYSPDLSVWLGVGPMAVKYFQESLKIDSKNLIAKEMLLKLGNAQKHEKNN